MEMRETIWSGQPVFGHVWQDAKHCPPLLLKKSWATIPGSRLFCCIDAGQTLQPAAIFLELTPGLQICAAQELVSEGAESMQQFAPRLRAAAQRRYPENWRDITFMGDRTVYNRDGSRGETAAQVAARFDIRILKMSNMTAGRYAAVDWALEDWIEEGKIPRYLVCGKDCPVLLKGFQGAYRFKERLVRDSNGQDLREPVKNVYSHPQDANQYGCVYLRRIIQPRGGGNTRYKNLPGSNRRPSTAEGTAH